MEPPAIDFSKVASPLPFNMSRRRTNSNTSNGFSFEEYQTAIIPVQHSGEKNVLLDTKTAYLKFSLHFGAPVDTLGYVRMSDTAMCYIKRLRVLNGHNVLQDIDSYNLIYSLLLRGKINELSYLTNLDVLGGARSFISGGHVLTSGVAYTAIQDRTYCLPLLGTLFDTLDSQFVPLEFFKDLKIEITFDQSQKAFDHVRTTVNGLEFIADVLQLDRRIDLPAIELTGSTFNYRSLTPIRKYTNRLDIAIPATASSAKAAYVIIGLDRPDYAIYGNEFEEVPFGGLVEWRSLNFSRYQFTLGKIPQGVVTDHTTPLIHQAETMPVHSYGRSLVWDPVDTNLQTALWGNFVFSHRLETSKELISGTQLTGDNLHFSVEYPFMNDATYIVHTIVHADLTMVLQSDKESYIVY